MKIAILGYGKLGQSISQFAEKQNHEVGLKINSKNIGELSPKKLAEFDVAIECSSPETSFSNLMICAESNIPTVCGTTGWLDKKVIIEEEFNKRNGAFLYASNFSIGMNIVFLLNKQLAELMAQFDTYAPLIKEVHHIHKKDKPSGTAITLANDIINNSPALTAWKLSDSSDSNELAIESIREANVSGLHTITYNSSTDSISLEHNANNRDGFAQGAVLAAEWILDKKGIFSMQDVFHLHNVNP